MNTPRIMRTDSNLHFTTFWLAGFLTFLVLPGVAMDPPWPTDADEIASILRETDGALPYAPASNREAWMEVRKAIGMEAVGDILAEAAEIAQEPMPVLPASLYLAFERTGERTAYERMVGQRYRRLSLFTLAECLEGQERFADSLLDLGWAMCEQSTWVLPAHRDALPDPTRRDTVALMSAKTGLELGIMVHLLEDRLDPRLIKRIRYEANRRLFEPYLKDDFGWRHSTTNWNAVCNAGVMAAAVLLEEDIDRLAKILSVGLESLPLFVDGFTESGGTSEGVSYWQYGFGHYVLIGHLLDRRTEGRIDLFADPKIEEIALFPVRCELSPGRYTTFSDASSGPLSVRWIPRFLAQRLDLHELETLATRNPFPDRSAYGSLEYKVLSWLQFPEAPSVATSYEKEATHFFPELEWLIWRAEPQNPDGLVVAAKVGHNAEMHNHNDVGSFMVHLNQESILIDPGAGVYSRQYFGKERYDFFATSSRGHPVPIVNGHFQRSGADARGKILKRGGFEKDEENAALVADLSAAYPEEAGVKQLQRMFYWSRVGKRTIQVTDSADFKEPEGTLESVLITKGEVTIVGAHELRIEGERGAVTVQFELCSPDVRLERHSAEELQMRDDSGFITRIIAKTSADDGLARIQYVIRPD